LEFGRVLFQSLIETIREYAAERLEREPALSAAARRAHAEYFAEFARTSGDQLSGPGRERALAELSFDVANLLSAWRYWVEARELEQLNKLVDALWGLHDARGWYHGAVALTNDLLAAVSAAPATVDRAREEITLQTSLARGLVAIGGGTPGGEGGTGRGAAP